MVAAGSQRLTRPASPVWPPDYRAHYEWRQRQLLRLRNDARMLAGARAYYAQPAHVVDFIEHWCDTYDPRNAGKDGRLTRMPFILFPKQREFVEFLQGCLREEANGLIEKSRDMGATWLCIAFGVWLFFFVRGAHVGWGSRKAASVDRIGDMDSIFEKTRFMIRSIPREFWPPGFGEDNMAFMKIYSPETESAIIGESGDEIGRGGRTLLYFKDESAHYVHPEAIEASLSDNTRVQIDISSVGEPGNVFHRKRRAGQEWRSGRPIVRGRTNVFVMDWRDHPEKTPEWYRRREAEAVDNGLLHIFRREVDRDYEAARVGVIIPPAWIRSAIDAHLKIKGMTQGGWHAGLDVADGGGDLNAVALREGVVLRECEDWGERDVGVTTRRAIAMVRPRAPLRVMYDCIGVGAGVKAEVNRLRDENELPEGVEFVAWDAGAGCLRPEERVEEDDDQTPLNKDFYSNLKAQGWWQLRRRFERTHRAITEGIKYDPMSLISIDKRMSNLWSVQQELSQPTYSHGSRMRLVVNKTPKGTRSPNKGDAIMQCFWPVEPEETSDYDESLSWVD